MSLSDKIMDFNRGEKIQSYNVIHEEEVKEFIKELKDELLINGIYHREINNIIDKLAGEKLI